MQGPVFYEPVVCFVAQGRKRVMLGDASYDQADDLIVSMDLPVTGAILDAVPERPYLSVSPGIGASVLADMLWGHRPRRTPPGRAPP